VDEAVIRELLERLRAACLLPTHLRVAPPEVVDGEEDEAVVAVEVASGNETIARATTTSVLQHLQNIRSNNVQDDDNSDVSDSYTPLPTRTKSGRSVNKPVSFVPMLPEPSQTVKRRKSTKTLLAAKCKTCRRDVDPSNNRIVFCDACSAAYHQYCHDPPIDNDVVTVLEKEWLCTPCQRAKENVVVGTEQLVAVQNLSVDEVMSVIPRGNPPLISLGRNAHTSPVLATGN